MIIRVAPYSVTGVAHCLQLIRIDGDTVSDDEECRLDAVFVEDLQYPLGIFLVRTVVKGQVDDLVAGLIWLLCLRGRFLGGGFRLSSSRVIGFRRRCLSLTGCLVGCWFVIGRCAVRGCVVIRGDRVVSGDRIADSPVVSSGADVSSSADVEPDLSATRAPSRPPTSCVITAAVT